MRAQVLSISGTTITKPGIVYTSSFTPSNSYEIKMVGLTSTTALAVYVDSSGASRDAIVLSVSGSVVTFNTGGKVSNWAPSVWPTHISLTALSSTKVLACYSVSGTQYGTATVLNISGTTVTDGGVDTTFESAVSTQFECKTISSTVAVVGYYTGDIKAQIITISGSTPTSNTPVSVDTVSTGQAMAVGVFDATHVGLVYDDNPTVYVVEIGVSGTTLSVDDTDSFSATSGSLTGIAYDSVFMKAVYNGSGDAVLITLASASHLWLSADGAATFTNIGDAAWGASVVGGVVVVPGTAYQTIFAAVGSNLYKTINGGSSWSLETAITYEVDFIDLEKDNTTVILANRASGGNRASLWDSVGASLSHINTGKSTTGGATSGGDVV
jgi:hypothetical protein